jgi:hypothetical protein
MMTTLIQLIGAQPLPNLLPPLYLKPGQTILIYTPQTDQVRRRIESVIGQCHLICCDAYDIESLVKELDEELANQQGTDLIFNLRA